MNQRERVRLFGLIVLAFGFAYILLLFFQPFFSLTDFKIHTLHFNFRYGIIGKEKISPHLAVFNIDNQFMKKYNVGAADRSEYGRILHLLKKSGVKTLLFDIVFKGEKASSGDRMLVENTSRNNYQNEPSVFYPLVFLTNESSDNQTAEDYFAGINVWYPTIVRAGEPFAGNDPQTPFPALASAAAGLGAINYLNDEDFLVRRLPLIFSFRDGYVPSLVLTGICDFYNVSPENIEVTFGQHIQLKKAQVSPFAQQDLFIPIDNKGQLIINYVGPWLDSIKSYSPEILYAQNTESGDILKEYYGGTLILLGDITTDRKHLSPNVFDKTFPHSGILSHALNTILTANYIYEGNWVGSLGISVITLFIFFITIKKTDKTFFHLLFFPLITAVCFLVNFLIFLGFNYLSYFSVHYLGLLISFCIIVFYKMKQKNQRAVSCAVPGDLPEKSSALPNQLPGSPRSSQADSSTNPLLENTYFDEFLDYLEIKKGAQDVIRSLLAGKEYKVIAAEADISEGGIKKRIFLIYKKIGVKNKIELNNVLFSKLLVYINDRKNIK